MTKQEMMNTMVKSFGMENEHVINFFRWCEANPEADYSRLVEAYNTHNTKAVRDILNGSVRIW